MKKVFLLGIAVILVFVGIFFLKPKKIHNQPSSPTLAGEYCFSRIQRATEEAPYAVEEHIRLNVSNATVSGVKVGTQAGPDMTNGYFGTLEGSILANTVEVIYSFTVEGSQNKEKEIYEVHNQELIKMRWPLREEKDILIPDTSGNLTKIIYIKEMCSDNTKL